MAAKFELKKSRNDEFLFNLLTGNGQVILSSEMYKAKASALNSIESVRKNALDDKRYELFAAQDGSSYFTLKATNGLIIGRSQMYSTAQSRDVGIESVKNNASGAILDDQT